MNGRSAQHKAKYQREERITIVAELLRKGKPMRAIANEVMIRLGLPKAPSTSRIHEDAQKLLKEWRTARIHDMDLKIEKELSEIEWAIEELQEQWEKSKTDQKMKSQKQKAMVVPGKHDGDTDELIPMGVEKTTKEEIWLGDPRYLAEIRAQQMERRKLEGTYAPEKSDQKVTSTIHIPVTPEDVKTFQENFRTKFRS